MSFTCPKCAAVSHNPNDERERYCARCRGFVDDHPPKTLEELKAELVIALRTAIAPIMWRERVTPEFITKVEETLVKVLKELRESARYVPLLKIHTEAVRDRVHVTFSSDDPETQAWLRSLHLQVDVP